MLRTFKKNDKFALKADKSRAVRRTFWLIKVVPTWKKFDKRCNRHRATQYGTYRISGSHSGLASHMAWTYIRQRPSVCLSIPDSHKLSGNSQGLHILHSKTVCRMRVSCYTWHCVLRIRLREKQMSIDYKTAQYNRSSPHDDSLVCWKNRTRIKKPWSSAWR
jgi:hypothetical protein